MILRAPQQGVTLYRAFTPRWAIEPLSGAGAARTGGRFNRKGVPALYLSHELATAAAEYQQGSPFLPPFTMVSYRGNLPELVDVLALDRGEWDPLWEDWSTAWRQMDLEGDEPPSWVLSDMVRDAGIAGIRFPSTATQGGVNLVLFLDMLSIREILAPQDPDGLLPNNPAGWADD